MASAGCRSRETYISRPVTSGHRGSRRSVFRGEPPQPRWAVCSFSKRIRPSVLGKSDDARVPLRLSPKEDTAATLSGLLQLAAGLESARATKLVLQRVGRGSSQLLAPGWEVGVREVRKPQLLRDLDCATEMVAEHGFGTSTEAFGLNSPEVRH